MNDESYELWFKPVRPVSLETGSLVIQVPNPFFSDWMRDHYQSQIEKLLHERVGEPVSLAFQILRTADLPIPSIPMTPAPMSLPKEIIQETHLNPRYAFDTFVVGHS